MEDQLPPADSAGVPAPATTVPQIPPQTSTLRAIFVGPNGLRAGWRLLIYFGLMVALATLIRLVRHLLHPGPRPPRAMTLDPIPQIYFECIALILAVVPALILLRIEKEHWGHYGLPLRRAFRSEFWFGALWGFVGLSVIMLCLWAGHFYTVDGLALHGMAILKYGVLWAIGMLLVGLFEEFSLRGYPQYALASGIGFWPAALVLSFLFLLGHMRNPGENWLGLTDVFLFGLFACFTLWRTGNLWFAVGVHAAWDWGLTFLYSGPNSGVMATGQLLKVRFSGPAWLTGGSAGPEGSAINLVFDLSWFVVFALIYRKRKWIGMSEHRAAAGARVRDGVLIDSSALSG
jgi:membrane protease YdiL (CAAX protease family)